MFGVVDTSELLCELTIDRDIVVRAQLRRGGFSALLDGDTWDEHYRGKSPREAWEILGRDIARADAHMHGRTGSPPVDFAAFGALVDAALDSQRIEDQLAARLGGDCAAAADG
jgi:hypothetical protein